MDTLTTPTQTNKRLLRLPEVLRRVSVCTTEWYAGIRRGDYPRAIKLGRRAVAWREDEIDALVERLSAGPRSTEPAVHRSGRP